MSPSSAIPSSSRDALRELLTHGTYLNPWPEVTAGRNPPLMSGRKFPFVIAIVPAYNEQDHVLRTLKSLRDQTRRPDEIIVLADNCTDGTVALALAAGVSVVETKKNRDGKGGALNQLLKKIMPILDDDDCILVMDADTVLNNRFIESTVTTLFTKSRKPIAGIGGIFLADDDKWNLVRQLQSNEYVRYQRRLRRRMGRALVLTGTGTVFKVGALRAVQEARRNGRLPDLGKSRGVYDTSGLTEDNELTLSIKELGFRVISPKDCTVKTAMMPNLVSLYKQRVRWQRGALENLIAHGFNRHTAPYMLRQFLTYLGVLFMPFYLYTLTVALISQSDINFFYPLWVAVAIVYLFEQTLSVRAGGMRAILVSLLIIPELLLNAFLNLVYLISAFGALFATNEDWGRVRSLDRKHFDHKGRPTKTTNSNKRRKTLHGTHAIRQGVGARLIETLILMFLVTPILVAILLPLVNLQLAWWVIAAYVLVGFAATLARLVPVRTF